MTNHLLLPEADQDMTDIVLYTKEKWGREQVYKYVSELEACFSDIASGHVVVCEFEGFAGVYSVLCNEHYVFYMKDDPVLIIGIIHTSRDIMRHLKGRTK
ncbi:MAG: type II toxin-antitoxin system RelE/ParE family toxin [Nitrosomonadaceae bacterium]